MKPTPTFTLNALKFIIPTANLERVKRISELLKREGVLYSKRDIESTLLLLSKRLNDLEQKVC